MIPFACSMSSIFCQEEIAGEFIGGVRCQKLIKRSLSLWHTGKKKPIFTQAFAHGIDETPRWITSIAHLRGSDLFASGKSAQKAFVKSKLTSRIMGRSNPFMVH